MTANTCIGGGPSRGEDNADFNDDERRFPCPYDFPARAVQPLPLLHVPSSDDMTIASPRSCMEVDGHVRREYASRGPIHLHVFMRSNLIPEWGQYTCRYTCNLIQEWGQYTCRYILKDESGDMEREG